MTCNQKEIKVILKSAVTAVCLAMTASVALADNFRCPNDNIVSTGDRVSLVTAKCDTPSSIARREEPVKNEEGRTVYVEVQEWTYNRGPNEFVYVLIFRNGVLKEVLNLGYGY
jgi:hypothetical protein